MPTRRLVTSIAIVATAVWLASCSTSTGPTEPDGPVGPPVILSASPEASEVAVPSQGEVDFRVAAESPSGRPLSYEYRVDGTLVTRSATYTFHPPGPGDFRVEAIVSDGLQEVRRTWAVTVQPPENVPPTAVLALDPASGTGPLTVRVRLNGNDSDGSVVRYRVALSGPSPLTIERAAPIDTTLVFSAGSHVVEGTVEDDRGARTVANGVVEVAAAANAPPVATLVVDPASGTAPLDVRIEGGGSDPDGTIREYALDIDGDGVFDVQASTPITQSVRFEGETRHWIRLRVTDDAGATARDSVEVRVSAPASSGNLAPTLDLALEPTSGPPPLAVHARITGRDPDGSVVRVTIDFDGDGLAEATADGDSLTADHTYQQPGVYTVRATVTDDGGEATSRTATVTVADPNSAPTGSLSASATGGDAPLEVVLSANGSDADGEIVAWEVDTDQGNGFVELDSSRRLTTSYAFREAPYRPRLRLTDDGGATTVVPGPEVTVHRPISPDRSAGVATGNPRFDDLSIAPAVWADGRDALRFTITVRDPDGQPLADVPVRVRSLRPELVAPDGTQLGGTVTISLDGTRTDAFGRVTGALTTRTSSRVFGAPTPGEFVSFALMVEADAGHGEWRRLPDIVGLNAETTVYGNPQEGQFYVTPQGLTCVGQTLEIHVRGVQRADAPNPGAPAVGMYTEIRYAVGGEPLATVPAAGYESWRTDADGWIAFHYTPTAPDFRTIRGWVDGQPLNITVALAAQSC